MNEPSDWRHVAIVRRIRGALETLRLRRQIATTPLRALADVGDGDQARLTGIARPLGAALEAPLTGRACVYYAAVVLEHRTTGHIHELASEQDGVTFVIEDGAHRAIVDPAYARVSAGFDPAGRARSWRESSAAQQALLDRVGKRGRYGGVERRELEFREAVIELDEPIAVVGIGCVEPDPGAAPNGLYREGVPTRLRLIGSARRPLIISDDPKSIVR